MWRHKETIAMVQMRDDGDLDKAIQEVEMVITGWIQDVFRKENQ